MLTRLPLELFSLIAIELRDDKSSLKSLCQTSSTIYHLVIPIIYEDVSVSTNQSLMNFCLAVNRTTSRLGSYAQVLRLGKSQESYIFLSTGEVQNFRTTLMLMPNLRELHLDLLSRSFNDCFTDLKPSFKLQRLCVSPHKYPSFSSFLCNQPFITELRFLNGVYFDEILAGRFLSTQQDALPKLHNITGSLFMVLKTIPGRPVTTVMFNMRRWKTAVGLRENTIPETFWEKIYSVSTTPITTTGFYHWQHEIDPWPLLIPALRNLKAHLHLRRIRVIECFSSENTSTDQREALNRRIEQFIALGDFEQLEAVEVAIGALSLERGLPRDQVLSWLGEMNKIAVWNEHVPSLKQVTLYGVELK